MTATRIGGIVLIAIGLTGVLWGGISWKQEKTVVDLGPIEAKRVEHKLIPIHPFVGGIAVVAGIVLLVLPARRKS